MRRVKQKLTREQREYDELVHRVTPRSEVPWALVKAFVVGGIICCIGQLVADCGKNLWGLEQKDASTLGSVFLVFLASLLTGLGVFDQLGKFAGAGTFVPITGFANSIVSPWSSSAKAMCWAWAPRCSPLLALCWSTASPPQ